MLNDDGLGQHWPSPFSFMSQGASPAPAWGFLELVEAAKHYPTLRKQWVEFLGERPDAAIDRVETSEVTAA